MNRGWKGLLAVAAATAVTLALAAGPANAATQGWWSTEGYTVTNSGFNPNETALTVSTVPGLKLKSTTSPDRTAVAAPVLDKGRIFVYDSAGVTAYDEVTGKQLWRHDFPADRHGGYGRLVVSGAKLVVAYNMSGNPIGTGVLDILDVTTGTTLSSATYTEGFTQLLVDKGVVVVSGQSRYDEDTHAFSLSDLKPLWSHDLYMYQAASANGRILLYGYDNNVMYSRILDIVTGKVLYSVKYNAYQVLAASSDGTKFYVAWGHSLQVLDASTGKLTWLASNLYPTYAAVSPTRLYLTNRDGEVLAVNITTGAIFWRKTISGAGSWALIRPIVAGGVLYVTFPGKQVYAFNPVNGTALSTPALTGTVLPPVVTNGKLYVTDSAKMSVYGL